MTRSKPQDSEAYNLALQGRFFLDRRGQKDLERAVEYFRQARERDPSYAPAWAGLSAGVRDGRPTTVSCRPRSGYRQAREAAEKALALDPQLVDAHLAMGWIQNVLRLGLGGRGRQLSPGTGPGTRQRPGASGASAARRLTLGRWTKRSTWRTRPSSAIRCGRTPTATSALALLAVNRDAEAEAACRKALELDPGGTCRHDGARAWPCFCRARPTPPCRKCSRKRRRSGGSQDCRSHFTRSAGAASPTRRWRL